MTHTKAMTVRLPVDLAGDLEAVAAIDGKPVAEVVRVAVDNFLRQRKADPVFQLAVSVWLERLTRLAHQFMPEPDMCHSGQLDIHQETQ